MTAAASAVGQHKTALLAAVAAGPGQNKAAPAAGISAVGRLLRRRRPRRLADDNVVADNGRMACGRRSSPTAAKNSLAAAVVGIGRAEHGELLGGEEEAGLAGHDDLLAKLELLELDGLARGAHGGQLQGLPNRDACKVKNMIHRVPKTPEILDRASQ